MDEGNVALLEKPLIDNPEAMLEMRDEVRHLHYSKMVESEHGKTLPKNVKELREGLDAQVEQLSKERSEHEKKEGEKKVPDKVLRKMEDWSEFGWGKEDRKAVKARLHEVLGLDENACEHALESIVAKNLTPTDALQRITTDALTRGKEFLKKPDAQDQLEGQEEVVDPIAELGSKILILQRSLGIDDKYIKRFILNKEFQNDNLYDGRFSETYHRSLQDEFDNSLPANLFDLAWNVGFENEGEFGINGKTPVLQMQVQNVKVKDANGKETGEEKVDGRYVVNQGNWMRWIRSQINWWYREYDTDVVTDYFSKIEIKKGPYYNVNLVTMLFNSNRYFRDETGHKWDRLYDQTLLEPWMMMMIRQYYIDYEHNMGSEEKLAESYNSQFFLSKLTRKIYGTSMVNLLTTLPEDFEGKDSDTKLGESWMKMFLAYYNMTDFEKLKEVLGEDSDFFKYKGWEHAIKAVNKEGLERNGTPVVGINILGDRQDSFEKAFKGTENGEITNVKEFINFVNIFTSPVTPSTSVEVINEALKESIAKKLYTKDGNLNSDEVNPEHLDSEGKLKDKETLDYAWLLAHTWSLFTGAAAKNNFPSVSGHNAETKWLYPEAYRRKYSNYGGAGVPYTIPMFKQLSLPLLEGVLLENAYDYYVSSYDEKGKKVYKKRQMTPMEVMTQMHKYSEECEKERVRLKKEKDAAPEGEKAQIQRELDLLEEKEKNKYKIIANQLTFNEDAMKNYAQNVIGRAKTVYETVMGAHEIAFDKFTKYDGVFRGVSFDRAEWQKALQGGMITPLRYLFDANGATQLNMEVRAPVYDGKDEKGKPKWRYENMPLGKAMMGHQILDIPAFRQEAKDLTPERWEKLKDEGCKVRGQYIVDANGDNVINYDRVQENKTLAYKQWMLMKLAGDLWTHIDLHSTDSAYGMEHYMNILDAIAALPGDFEGNEFNLQEGYTNDTFFSKEQMRWLKDISGTTTTKLFFRQFFRDLFQGDPKKQDSRFGEAFSIIIGTIFKGY